MLLVDIDTPITLLLLLLLQLLVWLPLLFVLLLQARLLLPIPLVTSPRYLFARRAGVVADPVEAAKVVVLAAILHGGVVGAMTCHGRLRHWSWWLLLSMAR